MSRTLSNNYKTKEGVVLFLFGLHGIVNHIKCMKGVGPSSHWTLTPNHVLQQRTRAAKTIKVRCEERIKPVWTSLWIWNVRNYICQILKIFHVNISFFFLLLHHKSEHQTFLTCNFKNMYNVETFVYIFVDFKHPCYLNTKCKTSVTVIHLYFDL